MGKYYALGFNYGYSIEYREGDEEPPPPEEYSEYCIFDTLEEAKRQVRDWLASDRAHIAMGLLTVNAIRASDLKRREGR